MKQTLLILSLCIFLVRCSEDKDGIIKEEPVPSLPTLATITISEITSSTAVSGGNITDDAGSSVTARGICWSTSPNPTIDHFKTSQGSGTGAFSSLLASLQASTTYYVRAYATSKKGTAYGNELNFT